MPNDLPPPRLLVEPIEVIFAGDTAAKQDLAAAGQEPLPENPQATLVQIRECPAYKDHRHPDHQMARDQERRLCFGIVHAADKAAEAEAADAEKKLTMEEQRDAFSDDDVDNITAVAVSLFGQDGFEKIRGSALDTPVALRELAQLDEPNSPGVAQAALQFLLEGMTEAQADRAIHERMKDKVYHDNQDFGHVAARAEMRALYVIKNGELAKCQELLHQHQLQAQQ